MTESSEYQCKRLRFRSWHCGTRELDLVLGPFADATVAQMTPGQLDRYEALLAAGDPDIYRWINGGAAVPEIYDNDVMTLLKNFGNRALSSEISR